jgi:hypothetical protein
LKTGVFLLVPTPLLLSGNVDGVAAVEFVLLSSTAGGEE